MSVSQYMFKWKLTVYKSNIKSSMPAIICGEHIFKTFIQSFFTLKMIEKEENNLAL